MSLKAARTLLATDLETALGEESPLTVCPTVPESPPVPCVVVQAADPFLVAGETFAGDYGVSYDLIVLVDLLSNAQAIEDLEDYLEDLLTALAGTEYGLDSVGRPGPYHTADWVLHGLTVTVSRFVTL